MYRLGQVDQQLQPFVANYWMVHCDPGVSYELAVDVYVDAMADLIVSDGVAYRRVSADGEPEWVRRANVDAQRTRPIRIEQSGEVRVVGVRFRRLGLAAFSRQAMHKLTDRIVPPAAVFDDPPGNEPTAAVVQQLARHSGDAAAQSRLLDRFLLARLNPPPELERLSAALARFEREERRVTVAQFAREVGVSTRQLDRSCARLVGLTPKLLLQVVRFQQALSSMMSDERCVLGEVAARFGYADQSHLVREFHRFAGGVPARFRGYLPEVGNDFAPNTVRYD